MSSMEDIWVSKDGVHQSIEDVSSLRLYLGAEIVTQEATRVLKEGFGAFFVKTRPYPAVSSVFKLMMVTLRQQICVLQSCRSACHKHCRVVETYDSGRLKPLQY